MNRQLKILIADGNTRDRNDAMTAVGGELGAERYANEIRRMYPKAELTTIYPADSDHYLPKGTALGDYDGMVMGGSGLHAFDQAPEVTRQVDLMRSALEAGMLVLGSCWGLQVAAAATGGTVAKSPRGREVGIARKIALTAAGVGHALYADKPGVFDSPCIHYDEVTHLPAGSVILAHNAHSAVQAAVIRVGAGVFWGMQYHPEFDLPHLANLYRRYADDMLSQGYFIDRDALETYANALRALAQNPDRLDLRWQLGIDDDVLDADMRCREIRNWVESLT
ncbi:MAG: glutamine amidotransferase [Nitrospinae bacterium CG11_big_fil_rev_8_21_14_0_20_56_8]|nr:MAG: glutamine amidotransferase [Nitrospinae bacterium CG11_big_fil_rev_8_21_14_0_20_56_8]